MRSGDSVFLKEMKEGWAHFYRVRGKEENSVAVGDGKGNEENYVAVDDSN